MSEQASEVQAEAKAENTEPVEERADERTFTQAEVDRLIGERVKRERSKFSDYEELKEKAGSSKSLEERLAQMEKANRAAETRALRSDVAAVYGISAADRDLFLTADNEDDLKAQAIRLSEYVAEQKKRNNVVPKEGTASTPSSGGDWLRAKLSGR